MSAAVVFEGAGFAYGSAASGAAVRDVSLSVPRGQCVVVTGPSGCGKTTLTRMVNGLIPVVYAGEATGRVLVCGKSIADWEMDDLCCAVGSVFQNPRSQFFNLDTTSEIAFGCENLGMPRGEIRERVRAAASDLHMTHLLERDIQALSGGERQLVALASAYAMGSDVFVLDEPTASLDAPAMRLLASVLANLKAAGKTIIVAEHRLWWLADVVDRVVLMEGGRVTADWPAEEFAALSPKKRVELGLRAWSIDEVVPATCEDAAAAPTSAPAPALVVAGLRAGYRRGADVLCGLDLELEEGCVVALVGRNGAGKTTLARTLAGLHRESAGSIAIAGAKWPWRKRAGKVYLVMQETGYQLFSDSVTGELVRACKAGAAARKDVAPHVPSYEDEAALLTERFGLKGLETRHPLSLSGGQRQRLAVAAGIAQGARVMVLDEPTSGLDLGNMRRVAHELSRLREQGVSMLVITHDYEFLCAACNAVAELHDGKLRTVYPLSQETLPRVRTLLGVEGP